MNDIAIALATVRRMYPGKIRYNPASRELTVENPPGHILPIDASILRIISPATAKALFPEEVNNG